MLEKSKTYEKKSPRVYIRTFGCQMNVLDSEKMSLLLEKCGYARCENIEDANIVIFNTCTVREKSHHKAISEIGKAIQRKKEKKDIIVCIAGCVAQEEKANLFKILPGLDIAIGPDQIHKLPLFVTETVRSRKTNAAGSQHDTTIINDYESYRFVSFGEREIVSKTQKRVTNFSTIMKGCNNFCSFCIVPYVRGREVSRSPQEIIKEIEDLSRNGLKEITLLGQNVNSYGLDNKKFGTFTELIRRVSDISKIERIRYTSPHPKDMSEELIKEHSINQKLCNHIHLPVQAGSTRVLRDMNRRYNKDDYLKLVNSIRSQNPSLTITTDIIVGFPDETDDDFDETIDLMNRVEFDGMFAFKYSVRPNTYAAEKFEDTVPEKTKRERLAEVLELNEKIVLKKHKKYVGTVQEILIEGPSKRGGNQLTGRTTTNKIVNLQGNTDLVGKKVNVIITAAGPNSLKGKLKEN